MRYLFIALAVLSLSCKDRTEDGHAHNPDGSHAARDSIFEAHKNYPMGLYWFLTNDPSVPEEIRNKAVTGSNETGAERYEPSAATNRTEE